MDIANQLVVPFTTAAAKVAVKGGVKANGQPRTLMVIGPLVAVVVNIQIPVVTNPVGATDAHWVNWSPAGSAVTITATNMRVQIPEDMEFRINKPATAGNCGIILC